MTAPPAPLPLPRGLLFDLDGTLIDSEPLHALSTNRILAAHGARLSEEEFQPFIGWSEIPFWSELKQRFGLPGTPMELSAQRSEALLALLSRSAIEPMPGARRLLEAIRLAGVPCAVASSSPRVQIESALHGAGLRDLVQAWVSGHDDVARGKPAADPYVEAARRIGVDASACLAIEDSAVGARSARAAGCTVVMVPCPTHPERDHSAAHHVMESLEELHRRLELDGHRV